MASFIELRRGDRLPTVAVLQLLLNRTGAALRVDGIFGPNTEKALANFRRQRGLGGTGTVDKRSWEVLAGSEDLPIIDCIDVFDPSLFLEDAQWMRDAGASPMLIGGMSNGLVQAITMIRNAAINCGSKVFLLRFIGHGGPGVQDLTGGPGGWDEYIKGKKRWHPLPAYEANSGGGKTVKTRDHVYQLQASRTSATVAMSKLSGLFSCYGSIELHGCNVGYGSHGHALLKLSADAAGVPVSASALPGKKGYQYAYSSDFRFDSATFTAFPGRQDFPLWCAGLTDFAPMSTN
jgi:peptidoglycan hydrolase-like protein with peptidoglycan-binding domain